jgi:hypothetical protein
LLSGEIIYPAQAPNLASVYFARRELRWGAIAERAGQLRTSAWLAAVARKG